MEADNAGAGAPGLSEEPRGFAPEPPGGTGWAVGAHLSALLVLAAVPLANLFGPLVVWLIVRGKYPFGERHAREALNFNLSVMIYLLAIVGMVGLSAVVYSNFVPLGPEQESGVLVVLAAALLFMALAVGWFVLAVTAALRARRGEEYRYPLTMRLVRSPRPEGAQPK